MSIVKRLISYISPETHIYTDGSVKNNIGSWAYVVVKNKKTIREAYGSTYETDPLRMEYLAAIKALESVSRDKTAILFSDSRVVVDTANLWRNEWRIRNWQRKKLPIPLPNVDLIQTFDQLLSQRKISCKWVKAHSGIFYNERCDQLCIKARIEHSLRDNRI